MIDQKCIYGLQASYLVKESGILVQGAWHIGRDWLSDLSEELVSLEEEEYIEEVFGLRANECITQLGLKTSLGKTYLFGSEEFQEEGAQEFTFIAKKGFQFATLRCAVGH